MLFQLATFFAATAVGQLASDPVITEVIFDAPVRNLQRYDNGDQHIVWVVTQSGQGMYVSKDDGKTFESIGSRIPGLISNILTNPLNPDNFYVFSPFIESWVTTDGGETFSDAAIGLIAVNFHPEDPLLAVETRVSEGCLAPRTGDDGAAGTDGPVDCHTQLWLTEDGGVTTRLIEGYTLQVAWAAVADGVPSTRLIALAFVDKSGNVNDKPDSDLYLVFSDDFFATPPKHIAWGVESFALTADYFLASTRTNTAITGHSNAADGTDGAARFLVAPAGDVSAESIKVALLPAEAAQEFTIVETSPAGIAMIIADDMDTPGGGSGSLYVSDNTGLAFSKVFSGIPRIGRHRYEFLPVSRQHGVMLANKRRTAANAAATGLSSSPTWLTTNNGASWHAARHSLSESGEGADQDVHISLSPALSTVPMYSDDAPGLLIANGLAFLEGAESGGSFITRDFGASWRVFGADGDDAHEGNRGPPPAGWRVTAAAMNGNVVLAAEWHDAGEKQHEVHVFVSDAAQRGEHPEGELIVPLPNGGVVSDPIILSDTKLDSFMLVGVGENDRAAYHVNVGVADLRQCAGKAEALAAARAAVNGGGEGGFVNGTDFEVFFPGQGLRPDECFNGERLALVRRHDRAVCWDADSTVDVRASEPCVCGEGDWECAVGYVLNNDLMCEPAFPTPPAGCIAPDTYSRKKYQRASSNKCTLEGSEFAGKETETEDDLPCPEPGSVCPCEQSPHGQCGANGACLCEDGWYGPDCSHQALECGDGQCLNGRCVSASFCACDRGWQGAACDTRAGEAAEQATRTVTTEPGDGGGVSGGVVAAIVICAILLIVATCVAARWHSHREVQKYRKLYEGGDQAEASSRDFDDEEDAELEDMDGGGGDGGGGKTSE